MAALVVLVVAAVVVAAFVTLKPKSDDQLVSTAWNCQAFKDAEESGRDTDSLNYIANCAVKRMAVDSVHALRGETLEYGLRVDDLKTVMGCSTSGDVDEPNVTAKCLLDANLVEGR